MTLPNHLMDVVDKLHIITGPNGQCMCGIYDGRSWTCPQILAALEPQISSALVRKTMVNELGGKRHDR